jgi:hypothetical protein
MKRHHDRSWVKRKTYIAGIQVPNWEIVLGVVVVIFVLYMRFGR